MQQNQSRGARWYDKYPNISTLLSMAEHMPLTIQQNIGNNLLNSIASYQGRLGRTSELKSLGAETVLGMFKSKKKQRWYDTIPELYQAINHMSTLPPNVLLRIDNHCRWVVEFMESQKLGQSFNTVQFAKTIENYLGQPLSVEIRDDSGHLIRYPAD